MSEEIIMFDSPDAATYRTDIKGWVSRNGIFYGENNERTARYSGCTHVACSVCGTPTTKHYTKCDKCRSMAAIDRYLAMPAAQWDGATMLYSDARDEYYIDLEAVYDSIEEGESIDDLRLIICEPNYARQIEEDYFCDEMTEDGDLPDEVTDAMEAFNEKVAGVVLSWSPGKTRLDKQESTQ
jgi:hypothetical protein